MQKITPFLWFNDNAEEAMNFYTSLFGNSKPLTVARYGDAGPGLKGTVMTASFLLDGREFVALNGGPVFKFTPAISFFVNCETRDRLDAMWERFVKEGTVLMELDKYPFSERFGWLQDKFGLSWQFNLATRKPTITPFLMFVGKQHGRAEEAMQFYTSLFENSRILSIKHYNKGEEEPEGTVRHATFSLHGQEFMAIDSNREHPFTFNEAISFVINCKSQQEVDHFWTRLTEGGEESRCGWVKDKFGVSWQVVPTILSELLGDKDPVKAKRVMEAMLQMKKLDIQQLKQAYGR